MRCATNWIFLAAVIGLAGCQPAANNSTAKVSTGSSGAYAADIGPLNVDRGRLVPISAPINIAMQPMQSIAYTSVQSNAGDPDAKIVVKGRVWFERNKDGRIEEHRETSSGAVQSKRRNANIDLHLTASDVITFEPNGKVWSIAPAESNMPSTAPEGLTQEGWDFFRDQLVLKRSTQDTSQVLECATSTFTFAKGSIQTGTPVMPTTRREFFDQLADCMIALARGDPSPTHPDNIAFRKELMAASESDLPRIHDHVRDAYEQRWAESFAEYSSDVTVKGMIVLDGQEFAYADGQVNLSQSDGKKISTHKEALIDPYSGLVYQSFSTAKVSGLSGDDKKYAAFDGETVSTSIDLPSRTPTNVTIAQPRKPVTSPSGSGSVVDIYNRSIDAIYEVDTATGTGTAFAVSGQQAITAAHVVEGFKTVTLISSSGARLTAKVVKRDSQRDVALLDLAGAQFPTALNLSSDFAVTGAQVIVIGCPLGACGSVTTGIVSFSARRVQGVALVQIDAQINPGNSGGPILNTNGDVIGIVEEKFNPDARFDGLSFGLASPEIVQFLGT